MTRLGLGFLGIIGGDRMVEVGREAERLGFDSIWMAETRFRRDAFTPLAAIASQTRRVRLATCVINPFTRSPLLIAMSIATLDEVSGGRAVLGLGSSGKRWIEERYAMNFRRPVQAVIECIRIVRRLMAGHSVTYNGRVFRMKEAKLGFRPLRKEVPIYIGATGPRMLEVAGRIADGVVLNGFTSAEYVNNSVKLVRRGMRSRSEDTGVEIAGCILTCLDRNQEAAREQARKLLAGYLALPEMFRLRAKVGDSLLERASLYDRLERVRDLYFAGSVGEAAELVEDRLLDHLAIAGKPSFASERLREYLDAGLELPVICPVGSDSQVRQCLDWASKVIAG